MPQIEITIKKALLDFSGAVPQTNTDWVSILQVGPMNIFARWFEQGKVEVEEKINGVKYAGYITSVQVA